VTHGADNPNTLATRFNMALSLFRQQRYIDALSIFEEVLEKLTRVLPLDHPQTLTTTVVMANALAQLNRYDKSLKMFEDVMPKLTRVKGEDHDDTLTAMVNMATAQYLLRHYDDSKQTATRGLLIARRVGKEELAAFFVTRLSKLGKVEENKVFAATASDEQIELHNKIVLRRQAKEKAAADEAALLATRAEATTEDDLDALVAQFGFEEGDAIVAVGRARRRRVEEARRRRRRGGEDVTLNE
jgi:tetratricopeptide (TPR) repeat protein